VTGRLQGTEGHLYLWLTNPTRSAISVDVDVSARWGRIVDARVRMGKADEAPTVGGNDFTVTVPAAMAWFWSWFRLAGEGARSAWPIVRQLADSSRSGG